jgi:hypothetical protein
MRTLMHSAANTTMCVVTLGSMPLHVYHSTFAKHVLLLLQLFATHGPLCAHSEMMWAIHHMMLT